ncbi:hypothetical protein BSF38_00016 [Paludisphaera borealis]|uniref:Uncharacterized protein n=2 Tax=Paludisphaera borealis TaxID=1387353 RepID=A0A1U7CI87_9BACT|nr:hypothetical protein BSF38_00016 [Paludisphaera borealis]
MPHSNPVAIAKETVAIAKESGSPAFQKVATWTLIASAAVTTIVGLLHAAHTIARDLSRKPERKGYSGSHDRPKPQEARHAPEPPIQAITGREEKSWVEKARAADREKPARHRQPAYGDGHGHGGRH